VDRYTAPRPSTAGDLEEHSYLQSLFHAGSAGFAFMGWRGVGVTASASLVSTFVARKTGSRAAALAAGAVTGAVTASALGGLTGGASIPLAVGGALLGGLQALRGDPEAEVRDSAGGATMFTGLFLPGTAKIAGAIGAGLGSTARGRARQLTLAAATGAALGAALGAAGLAPGGILVPALVNAAGGALGTVIGPRFSQLFRNLANDAGRYLASHSGRRVSERTATILGAAPAQFLKEGIRGFIDSDFSLRGLLVGGIIETAELVHLTFAQKEEEHQP
jgi:hypothetical protein